MGCANSKADLAGDAAGGTAAKEGRASKSQLSGEGNDIEGFKEKLFADVGAPTTFNAGQKMIEEGKTSESAIYIRKGTAKLLKGQKEVATRGKGDLIGEMTLLLGDLPGVTVVADTAVEAYVVQHSSLTENLANDPSK